MKLTQRTNLGGYAAATIANADIDGAILDKPFVLLTGPNGAGKSALLRGIRASIGIHGERAGKTEHDFVRRLDPKDTDDAEKLMTYGIKWDGPEPLEHVPAVFDIKDLGWKGQPTYLFDSRAASQMASKASFDDDMGYHVSLIAGGGKNISHGQFVQKTWWEAIEWATGLAEIRDPWTSSQINPALQKARSIIMEGDEPSTERWLLIDEPETAIDTEALLIGLSVLLNVAEIGKLRIICASHSLLFAAGLINHPKVLTVDLATKGVWMETQKLALQIASDKDKLESIGIDILSRIRANRPQKPKPRAKPKAPSGPKKRAKSSATHTMSVNTTEQTDETGFD